MPYSRLLIALTAVALGAPSRLATEPAGHAETTVPWASGFLPNGFMGPGEWADPRAAEIDLGGGVLIHASQDSLNVYLGVRSADTTHTGLDLYLSLGEVSRVMLHVSSALAERRSLDSGWSDIVFGENDQWTANVVPFFWADGEQKTIAPEVFEFQIRKTLLQTTSFRAMVQFKRPERVAPPDADPDEPATWREIDL
jgi:hypothetical protein